MISFRPTDELGEDGWQFGLSSRATDLEGLIHDREALVNCIRDFMGVGDGVKVKEVMWASEFRPNMRMVNKFGVGRIFVAGDAAHVHSPAGGQGMNSSVQDALNLAWKIALVYKGFSPASLLDTYTAERLPVIAEMLGYTTEMHNVMFDESGADHTQPSTADDNDNSKNVESNLERGMRRGKNMYMLGVNYCTSPIVIDDSGVPAVQNAYGEIQEGILRASDRAPNAPGLVPILSYSCTLSNIPSGSQSNGMAADTRMFDLFASTYHTVIIFTPTLVVPFVKSVLGTLQQVVPKELVRRVVVLPCSPSEPDGHVEGWTSSEEDQLIDVEVLIDQVDHAYRGYTVEK
ncbi:FAD binding domain-containing protein [Pisolithus marmoratus]|nr:FAD binding domain-containing protein [Pisolithus marmoratus]